ncbi:MAG: hypothetical protein WD872_18865 [Pirellulaceae bacterium]
MPRSLRLPFVAVMLLVLGAMPGCAWFESLKGNGFPEWSDKLGDGARGRNPEAEPSGFFTDRRSEQIEKNLGGGF